MTVTESTMTQEVVQYIQGLSFEEIPSDVRQELTRCLVDGIGVVLSGVPAACSQIIQRVHPGERDPRCGLGAGHRHHDLC